MKYTFVNLSLLAFFISNLSYSSEFQKNGYLEFTQTFYGNAGKYKTKTSHPSVLLNYNISEKLNTQIQWDRTWNMYHYNGGQNQQDNSFSAPKATFNYNYGNIGNSKINWSSSFLIENENEFNHENQTYLLLQQIFDFSSYIPKGDYIKANQFAISPMYLYGWSTKGSSGHVNSAILSLLTNWQLPANFTFTFNAYFFREWYNGSFEIENQTTNSSYSNANYFMFLAWLQYSKELYKFNKDTSLNFNFTGGFDPYISSNRSANWDPFISGNQMYEWLGPTVDSGNNKNTYAIFALPQLQITYNYNEDISFSVFAQVKYSNQVWGKIEKDWKLQPQGGVSVKYNF